MPYTATEQICLDEKREKIVPCDSSEARSNLALPGVEIADDVAIKYGLMKGKPSAKVEAAPDEADDAELTVETTDEKAVGAPPANKAMGAAPQSKKK